MAKGFAHERNMDTLPDGEENEWYTPKYIFDAIGLEFDMDPCSPGEGFTFVPAKKHLTIVDDGLTSDWDGTVFMNPPYGKHTKDWMKKLVEHGNGIALVFSRTDVAWFQDSVPSASLVCFISSRIKFYKGGIKEDCIVGTPGAGSVLIAYGEKSAEALKKSGLGICMETVS